MSQDFYVTLHRQLLNHIYENLGDIFQKSNIDYLFEIDGYGKAYCPTIVGGFAYNKYMEATPYAQHAIFSDDIDIKISILPTLQELNKNPSYQPIRTCIKAFRALTIFQVLKLAHKFLTNQNVQFKISLRSPPYKNNPAVMFQKITEPMNPLELCCLAVTYYPSGGAPINFGLIDATFVVRESDDETQLTIKQFNYFPRFQSKIPFTRPPPLLNSACDVIGRVGPNSPTGYKEYLASPEFVMLDTVRMLSKVMSFGDQCIVNGSKKSDVYKFDKYVIKYLHMCLILHDPTPATCAQVLAIHQAVQEAGRQQELAMRGYKQDKIIAEVNRTKLRTLVSVDPFKHVYETAIQYIQNPSSGDMAIGGTSSKRKAAGTRKRGGAAENVSCSMELDEDTAIYNEFDTIYIEDRYEVPIPENVISACQLDGGSKRPRKATRTSKKTKTRVSK
jgi:hypothetical protein